MSTHYKLHSFFLHYVVFTTLVSIFSTKIYAQNGVGINTSNPKSSLEINGSQAQKVNIVSSSITLNDTLNIIVCNNGTTPITLTLPNASTCSGRIYHIKKNNTSTANVTLSATIDGTSNLIITGVNQSVKVFSDGSEWKTIMGGLANNAGLWTTYGNNGTSSSANFIGTTDAVDFVVKTNNTERARVMSGGNVLIGATTDAGYKLDVNGSARFQDYLQINKSSQTVNTLYTLFEAIGDYHPFANLKIQMYNYGPRFLAHSFEFYVNGGTSKNFVLHSSNAPSGGAVELINGDIDLKGGILGTGWRLLAPRGIWAYNHTSFIFNPIQFTGFAADQGVGLNNYSGRVLTVTGNGNVLIGTTTEDTSAVFNATSTKKGLLLPRMTASQIAAIGNPATGLLAYQTDGNSGFYYYNGSAWVPFLSSMNGWSITGNSGTTASTNFIGTTDAVDFIVKTNNTERARVMSGGNVLIGTTTDAGYKLDVIGGAIRAKGVSTSNSAYSLVAQNSIGSNMLRLRDDGYVLIGEQGSNVYLYPSTIVFGGFAVQNHAYVLSSFAVGDYNQALPNSLMHLRGSLNGGSNLDGATGLYISTILNATQANHKLRGIYVNPSYAPGAHAGVSNIAIETVSGNTLLGTTSGSVGIGANMSVATSAILDITSTAKGTLLPRMTKTQRNAISSPATSLLIFQTDSTPGFYYYTGSAWVPFLSNVTGWTLSGNSGTTAGINFIGTTDAVDFVLKTNNTENARITSAGNFLVGTNTAGAYSAWKFHVYGSSRFTFPSPQSSTGEFRIEPSAVNLPGAMQLNFNNGDFLLTNAASSGKLTLGSSSGPVEINVGSGVASIRQLYVCSNTTPFSNNCSLLNIGPSNTTEYTSGASYPSTTNYYGISTVLNAAAISTNTGVTAVRAPLVLSGRFINILTDNTGLSVGLTANTQPSASLHIRAHNTVATNNALLVQNSTPSDLFVVKNGGNVGIGISNPNYLLDIAGQGASLNIFDTNNSDKFLVRTGSGTYGFSEAYLKGQSTDIALFSNPQPTNQTGTNSLHYSALTSGISTGNSLAFDVNGAERMRIHTSGAVGIGTSGIDASAKLQIESTTQGVLPPRMTTAQRTAITSPAEGLMVYDIDIHKLFVYDGTTWQAAW